MTQILLLSVSFCFVSILLDFSGIWEKLGKSPDIFFAAALDAKSASATLASGGLRERIGDLQQGPGYDALCDTNKVRKISVRICV